MNALLQMFCKPTVFMGNFKFCIALKFTNQPNLFLNLDST